MKIPIDYIIELGLIRKKNICAKCGKKMNIPDYHIQLCRKCREKELVGYINNFKWLRGKEELKKEVLGEGK